MVKRYIEGGYGLSEMEEDEQGDWVSYEDYEALRQKLHAVAPPQDDGWIEWCGGACPVNGVQLVDIKFRNGIIVRGYNPQHLDWCSDGDIADIIAYRIVS